MKINIALWLTSCLLLSLVSCTELNEFNDIDDISSDREVAFPLVYTDLAISDILGGVEEDISLQVGDDNILHFKYSGDVLTKSSQDIFGIINAALGIGGVLPLTSDDITLPPFPSGIDIDRMDLKAGSFFYRVEANPNNFPVDVVIESPHFVKAGVPLKYSFTIPANHNTPTENVSMPTDLDGYSIIPGADNMVHILSSYTDPSGNPVNVTNPAVGFTALEFSYAEGYLGQETYDESRDTIHIDFFENWVNGSLKFIDPEITIDFENSFGVPTRSVVEVFEVFTVTDDVLPLESSFVDDGIDFPYPTLSEVGQTKYKTFTFNKDNSNIDDILSAGPLALDYDVNAFTNPDNDPSIIGFATDTSYYKVRVNIDLPLYVEAYDFAALDTFEIDLDSFDEATEAEIKIVTENGIPLEIGVQGYFLAADNQVIDSLFADPQTNITAPAPVDSDGFTTGEKTEKVTYVPLSVEKIKKVKTAEKMIVKGFFSTETVGPDMNAAVKITDTQDINIRMGIKAKL